MRISELEQIRHGDLLVEAWSALGAETRDVNEENVQWDENRGTVVIDVEAVE